MRIAIVRPPSAALARCELSFLARQKPDLARALRQHDAYCACLAALGFQIVRLPAEPELPDATFVEDPAVVLDEVAVITRVGAASRRPESASVTTALRHYRSELRFIAAPATLDGGDVLLVDRTACVGVSGRTNRAAIAQLGELLQPLGYQVQPLEVRGCLHLKGACSYLGNGTFLFNPAWLDPASLRAAALSVAALVECHPDEPFAANTLSVDGTVLLPRSCPRTAERVAQRGFEVGLLDISEIMKAEGGLSCLSLRLESNPAGGRLLRSEQSIH